MSRRKKSHREPHGCFLSQLCTDVETTLVCHSWDYGETLVMLLYLYCVSFSASNSSRSLKTWDIGISNMESLIIKRKSSQLSKPGRKSIVWKDIGEEASPHLDMKNKDSTVSTIHCHCPTLGYYKSQQRNYLLRLSYLGKSSSGKKASFAIEIS